MVFSARRKKEVAGGSAGKKGAKKKEKKKAKDDGEDIADAEPVEELPSKQSTFELHMVKSVRLFEFKYLKGNRNVPLLLYTFTPSRFFVF